MLSDPTNQKKKKHTHRDDPLPTATAHARPVVVAQLGLARRGLAGNFSRDGATMQEGLHPFHLQVAGELIFLGKAGVGSLAHLQALKSTLSISS